MNDGDNDVEEETIHEKVGDMKSQSQGGYTRFENSSLTWDMPYGIIGVLGSENSMRNWFLAAKFLGKKPKKYKQSIWEDAGCLLVCCGNDWTLVVWALYVRKD